MIIVFWQCCNNYAREQGKEYYLILYVENKSCICFVCACMCVCVCLPKSFHLLSNNRPPIRPG